jgi:hypothetical protein
MYFGCEFKLNIMKKQLTFICLLIFATQLVSCDDGCNLVDVETPFIVDCQLTQDVDSAKMYIEGTWNWLQEVRTPGSPPMLYFTPKTTGYSLTMVIKDGTAKIYKCDEKIDEYKMKVAKMRENSQRNNPEDDYAVVEQFDIITGKNIGVIPIAICSQYLLHLGGGVIGPITWEKVN